MPRLQVFEVATEPPAASAAEAGLRQEAGELRVFSSGVALSEEVQRQFSSKMAARVTQRAAVSAAAEAVQQGPLRTAGSEPPWVQGRIVYLGDWLSCGLTVCCPQQWLLDQPMWGCV